MTPAISRIVERGLSDATEDPIELDEQLMRSLSKALDGESITVDDAYWEAKITRLKQKYPSKRKRSA